MRLSEPLLYWKAQLVLWVVRVTQYFKYHLFLKTFVHKARWGGGAHREKDQCGSEFWAGRGGLPHSMWWQSLGRGREDLCRGLACHEKGGSDPKQVKRASILWGSLWWGVRAQVCWRRCLTVGIAWHRGPSTSSWEGHPHRQGGSGRGVSLVINQGIDQISKYIKDNASQVSHPRRMKS